MQWVIKGHACRGGGLGMRANSCLLLFMVVRVTLVLLLVFVCLGLLLRRGFGHKLLEGHEVALFLGIALCLANG